MQFYRIGRRVRLVWAIGLIASWATPTNLFAQTPLAEVAGSPNISVELSSEVVADDQVFVDDLLGGTSVQDLGLPASAALEAYHRLPSGAHLFSVASAVELGSIVALRSDVVRFDGTAYSIEFDGSAAGVPASVGIEALSTDGASLFLVFDVDVTLPGLVATSLSVVRWQNGAFSLAFDGAGAGVGPALAIDGLHRLANGNWLFSFDIGGQIASVAFYDEDVLEYQTGTGTWVRSVTNAVAHPAWAGADLDALFAVQAPPNPGAVQWTSDRVTLNEGGPLSTLLTASRIGGNSGAVSVSYASADATATAVSDYLPVSGQLAWANGEVGDRTVLLTAVDDAELEGPETWLVSLTAPQGGLTLGPVSTAAVDIIDDDVPPQGLLRFHQPLFEVEEDQGFATVSVERVGGSLGPASVDYTTVDGTALDGSDYDGASGTLSWPDGVDGVMNFDVTILDDAIAEGHEVLLLVLSNPAGAVLGDAQATLLIRDDLVFAIPTASPATLLVLIVLIGIAGTVRLKP